MKKIALLLALVWVLAIPVKAHEVPDLTRQGSITVTMKYGETAIAGGEMTLYRIGDIHEDNGDYSFRLMQDYEPSGATLEDVQSAETAKRLADFAAERKISGKTEKIGAAGAVLYADLKPGLYLLVQRKAAQGFEPAAPFLVSLPMLMEGNYIYQVDAGPKVSPMPTEKPDNPEQPETGQSGWPFWTFTFSAIALLILTRKKARNR